MQPEPRKPVKIGPCGISCTICRFCIHGQCECRLMASPSLFDRAACDQCPVVRCAATRQIAFCARDCPDFPCTVLERTVPYRWARPAAESTSAAPGSMIPVPVSPDPQDASQGEGPLRILCLGEFRVFRGDVELGESDWGYGKVPTNKIKAMLAFLLCKRTRGVRKETLINLLWPHQTDLKRANSDFHLALSCLHRALEPDLEPGTDSSYIQHQGERYRFAPQGPYWIDSDAFIQYADRAQALEQNGDPASAVECWARATDLYSGRFMAGIDSKYTCSDLYDWCAPVCYHYEQLFLTATMALAQRHRALGHHALAIERAREALRVEPALETAHRLLIQCLMEKGQLDHALGQYRVCEAELAFRQDRPPSIRTDLLFQELVASIRAF
jgi:DNA-binding SARP family transcriptional activator